MEFKDEPVALGGYRFSAGNLLMGAKSGGDRNTIEIDSAGRDLDRKIQDVMYTQPPLEKWGIFHTDRDEGVAKQFVNTLQQCIKQCQIQCSAPRTFTVRGGNRAENWV